MRKLLSVFILLATVSSLAFIETHIDWHDNINQIKLEEQEMEENCTILINGKEESCGKYVRIDTEQKYAMLPLVPILEELGAEVIWQTENKAVIAINNKEYQLDIASVKVTAREDGVNLLSLAPGANHPTKTLIVDGVFTVDNDSALLFFTYSLGIYIDIDYSTNTVYLNNERRDH